MCAFRNARFEPGGRDFMTHDPPNFHSEKDIREPLQEGLLAHKAGNLDLAETLYRRVLTAAPQNFDALHGLGILSAQVRNYEAAERYFAKSLAVNPNATAAAYGNYARALQSLSRFDDAMMAYSRALEINPDYVLALSNRATYFRERLKFEEAIDDLAKLVSLQPDSPYAKGRLLNTRMYCCVWDDIEGQIKEIEAGVAAGKRICGPFAFAAIATSAHAAQQCARIYIQDRHATTRPPPTRTFEAGNKIRLGYLCGEFHEHPVAAHLVGVLEHHDRDDFDVHLFDNGVGDGSVLRRRLEATGQFHDIAVLNDEAAAKAIADQGIDILVDLCGHSGKRRTQLFAERLAPIQVSYLGFAGTLGAPYMDYIVADRIVIPERDKGFYDEAVVYLPGCFLPNDDRRAIGAVPTRTMAGLPDYGTIFCCFNNSFKINPAMFDIWMQILREVEDSILWLRTDSHVVQSNLRREAEVRGVAGTRLVFAPKMPTAEDHLGRLQLADIFLDTLPFNAHATAVDALWCGVPIVTCMGATFPGRVAASLLTGLGLEELVAPDLENYRSRAIDLARDSTALSDTKARLKSARAAFFKTERYTRNLEAAYRLMAARHGNGVPSENFTVPEH
jgi:predicted O-linked N-acetylglucosamine transferase (SPINDLY family)